MYRDNLVCHGVEHVVPHGILNNELFNVIIILSLKSYLALTSGLRQVHWRLKVADKRHSNWQQEPRADWLLEPDTAVGPEGGMKRSPCAIPRQRSPGREDRRWAFAVSQMLLTSPERPSSDVHGPHRSRRPHRVFRRSKNELLSWGRVELPHAPVGTPRAADVQVVFWNRLKRTTLTACLPTPRSLRAQQPLGAASAV